MKDIEDLLRMTERPQDYTDEELQQLMSDPDMRAYYELMVKAEEGFTQRNTKRDKARRLWKIAAMFVGIILLSGLTFAAVHIMRSEKTEVRSQETEAVATSQPSTLNSRNPTPSAPSRMPSCNRSSASWPTTTIWKWTTAMSRHGTSVSTPSGTPQPH